MKKETALRILLSPLSCCLALIPYTEFVFAFQEEF